MNYSVVIVAAGKSERFSTDTSKILYQLPSGKRVIDQTTEVFLNDDWCQQIIIVLNEEGMEYYVDKDKLGKVVLALGGANRMESVNNGINATKEDIVLIHDGARPWIKKEQIHLLVEAVKTDLAAILTIPIQDTVKKIENGYIIDTLDRNTLARAQTPQAFYAKEIRVCYKEAMKKKIIATDDAEVYQIITKKKIKCIDGRLDNEKITTLEDVERRM